MGAKFPEVVKCENPGYATWVPGRSPQFKAHNHIGLAKSALKYHGFAWGAGADTDFRSSMAVYKLELIDGSMQWKLYAEIVPGTFVTDYPQLWKKK
jgi:hypothetical protein